MKKIKQIFLTSVVLCSVLFAQEKPKVKWNITTQFWARYSELNDGTTINGELTDSYSDISIRRLRIPVSSQITPKIYGYALFGGNNFNSKSKNFPLQVLDLYLEYTFSKKLEIGMGKSGWQGLNRWNVRSSKSLMGLDSPLFSLNTVNKNDDLGRNLSIWLKGQVFKFDYRFVISNPIMVTKVPNNGIVDFANNRPRKKISSYIKYQFFEEESNKSAYQTGTYINNKKVFNIGVGGQYQANAFANGDALLPTTQLYNMKNWAIDSFLSLPLGDKKGITAYLGYYNLDFGKNYIRTIDANGSIFDSGSGATFNKDGNGFPMIGSGATLYTQLGYAFPVNNIIAQPNIAIQHANFDVLNQKMTVYDFTINFYLNNMGHSNKLSIGCQYRPVFDTIYLNKIDQKSMAVLQYQISIK